ncbi:MAG: hypothetical protein U0264_06455 [Candidatus Kapaibacterium sp.]
MARFIIIFLLVVVAIIATITYLLGALRRFFVGDVRATEKQRPKARQDKILYQKDDVVVLKGAGAEPERRVE